MGVVRAVGRGARKAGQAVGGIFKGPGAPPAVPPAPVGPDASSPAIANAIAAEQARGGMGAGRKSTFIGATYNTGATVFPEATIAPPKSLKQGINDAFEEMRERNSEGASLRRAARAIAKGNSKDKRRSYIGELS
jgi:hypothetical protein